LLLAERGEREGERERSLLIDGLVLGILGTLVAIVLVSIARIARITTVVAARVLVDRLESLHRCLLKSLELVANVLGVVGVNGAAYIGNLVAHEVLVLLRQLVLVLVDLLLGRVDGGLGLVTCLGRLTTLAIRVGIELSLLDQPLDLLLGETARRLDGDVLLLASGLVDGLDLDDTVRVDIERDLDLRNTLGCWGNTALEKASNTSKKESKSQRALTTRRTTSTIIDIPIGSDPKACYRRPSHAHPAKP
jgi:hypothetical protein